MKQRWQRRWLWGLGLLLSVCSVLGWGLGAWSQGADPAQPSLGRLRLGAELYVQRCGSCHLPVPAQTLSTDTWRVLIQDINHYGIQLQPLPKLDFNLIWPYLRTYSRPIRTGETVPYRLRQSRFFRVLHPGVELSQPIGLGSCKSCHPAAQQLDYITLVPNWQQFSTPTAP
ncbi:diheme cytochrome C [Synechococcus sp. PCC 6312]|uniref:diheme cytochrome C n=1 Tax=Synechococcus sp. (strain ATCC 27167 / PCC 6312) TaxID=195253 RepID=UPI00029F315D|nr:diheme cytochrome C [Synechococcus sp. PCC 6312]AFY62182.1 Dihem cytochrome c [Synechococcus sp. PCC 6312]